MARDIRLICTHGCGYTTPTTTAALARRGLELHSCDRHRALAARAARYATRLAAVDRTPKVCTHARRHEHGDYVTYTVDHCRCRPCVTAAVAYERHRTRQTAYGRWQPYVDAAPARAHVEQLRAAGMGLKVIARQAGVAHGALAKLIYGERQRNLAPSKRIRAATEANLLAVTASIDTLGASTIVDGTGTRRRLQALVAIGWSMSALARRLEMTPSNFMRTIESGNVRAGTARAARQLYDEMWRTRPVENSQQTRSSATRARNLAAGRGWPPPLAWGDDTIDDPHVRSEEVTNGLHVLVLENVVDQVAIDRYLTGDPDIRLNRAEKRLAYNQMRAAGHTVNAASTRLRLSGATARLYEASRLRDNVDDTARDLHDLQAEEATP